MSRTAVSEEEDTKTEASGIDDAETIRQRTFFIKRNEMMRQKIFENGMALSFALAMASFFFLTAFTTAVAAQPTGGAEKIFASPNKAVESMMAAVKDDNTAELSAIFGPDSEDLISSGDPVADKNGRSRFLKAYEEQHHLEQANGSKAILHVGNKDFPFPIPLIRQDDGWRFDTDAGKEEILNRRIGRNELHTIDVLHAYVDAQHEFACMKRSAGSSCSGFAQHLTSSEGKRDGLYWPAKEGEKESPFGPLIAKATREGYSTGLDEEATEPFHGYYFKILKAQGEHADGGAFDYMANGEMMLGFAMVAYPAKYGTSGIMTFIVNQEGIIFHFKKTSPTKLRRRRR